MAEPQWLLSSLRLALECSSAQVVDCAPVELAKVLFLGLLVADVGIEAGVEDIASSGII